MTRRAYHRSAQRDAQRASGARTPRDAARRLALRCGLLQPRQRAILTGGGSSWLLLAPDGQAWRLDLQLQDFDHAPDLLAARQWVRRNLHGLRRHADSYRHATRVQDWMDSDGVVVTLDVVRGACRGLHRLEAP